MEYRTGDGPTLRIGIYTPIVIQTPGGHARWEETAGVGELRRVVEAADRLGFHHLTCSEHLVVPAEAASERGRVYWDPLATLSWVAACTSRIRLATNVLVLGYHHPVELLKRYGTLDLLSNGRLVLGVGVGSLREEFDLLGAPYGDRGRRADEQLRAIRSGWGRPTVEFAGEFFTYGGAGGLAVVPHAPRTEVPIWIGGRSRRSLQRAVELADGWTPFALRNSAVAEMLSGVDLPAGFEVVLPTPPLDPSGGDGPAACRRVLGDLAAAGATAVHAALVHHSADHYLEQLEALAGLAASG
ncbi:MAG TPA: TIGR03619 family F420-dependent LLM class oxidoreductase [Acidimicrobiales bacterium]|nr:TIGR03619 family F420-dependent LLM class oxidoreductase [Acidimicrobiales bacterium]